ncbi:MAG TPA: SET domain-containing protein [Longimicrobiales bacterium]|nr:SET domain-containing protein [Longimicrobiales bacterium]
MSVSDPGSVRARPSPSSCRIRVVQEDGRLAVRAVERIAKGQTVLRVVGLKAAHPTRHSLQVGWHTHVSCPSDMPPHVAASDYGWRFLNHSCAPNAYLRGLVLTALADIEEGAEITFDYNTTEWDIAHPFACACGAPVCVGAVKGFRHLDTAQRARLRPYLPRYLKAKLPRTGLPA